MARHHPDHLIGEARRWPRSWLWALAAWCGTGKEVTMTVKVG